MLRFMLEAKAKQLKKNEKGFTLVELIVVMAIVAILAALAIGRFGGFTQQAKLTSDYAAASTIASAATALMAQKPDIAVAEVQPDKLAAADLISSKGETAKSSGAKFVVEFVSAGTGTGKEVKVTDGTTTFYPDAR